MTVLGNVYLDQVPAIDTVLYTAGATVVARIIKCTVTNDTTSAQTITFHKVENGGAVGDDRLILNEKSVGANETYECPEVVGQVINARQFLSSIASAANQLTVALDVAEIVI